MNTLSLDQMSLEEASGAGGCIWGITSIALGLIGVGLFPPAGLAAGGLFVAAFLGDVTNTSFSCAEWLSQSKG